MIYIINYNNRLLDLLSPYVFSEVKIVKKKSVVGGMGQVRRGKGGERWKVKEEWGTGDRRGEGNGYIKGRKQL